MTESSIDVPGTEWSSGRRTAAFLLALAALGLAVTVIRWPADMGRAHWSEWFAFYFFPPFFWAGIFTGIAYTAQRVAVWRKQRGRVRLPLLGIWLGVLGLELFRLWGVLHAR